MNKRSILIGLFILIAFTSGFVFFNKTNKQNNTQQKTETKELKNDNQIEVSPTSKPVVKDEDIDAKLKEIDSDAKNIDNSFSDTAVDVMSE